MTIEITEFANVDIAVSPVGVSGGNFGILGFLTNETASATGGTPIEVPERSRGYTSLASVGIDWEASSEVYKAATAFYAQTPTPTDFRVLQNYAADTEAVLLGGGHDDLATLKTITGGSFSITIDSEALSVSGLDFSLSADLGEIASTIEAALDTAHTGTGITCEHNGIQFVIKGITAGTGDISFATSVDVPNTAEALGLDQASGVKSDGVSAESETDSLAAAESQGIEWVGLVLHKDMRDGFGTDSILDISNWCEAAKKIFCNTTNALAVLSSAITNTTFAKDKSAYPSASVFGRAASVNFSAIGSTITLNLKQMPTIVAEDLTPNEFATLRSKNASAVVRIGKTATAYTDSRMASGSWLDTTHGLLWLENRCEVDMFNLLYQSNTKVPYTQPGLNLAQATLERSLEAAVRNGLAGPGFLPDGRYLAKGYEVRAVTLTDTPSSDKGNRVYKGLSFEMTGAGALHEVHVSGQFSE
jgi:hypothetical protein